MHCLPIRVAQSFDDALQNLPCSYRLLHDVAIINRCLFKPESL
jgi:hypothetical protein